MHSATGITDGPAAKASAVERWLPVAGWVALLGGAALIVSGWDRLVPPCLFREITGLYCPGCGSGRALLALSRFDLTAALSANPLVTLGLPLILAGLAIETADSWGLVRRRSRFAKMLPLAVLIVVCAFWVLRNIPVWPLQTLAPH
ncbi:MAG: DUF2752 domain-containing protein [Coriobacteriia bacterium]|nr:DUF2752 domain-containing protein [Coriobacteriia bacterium]